MNWLKQIWTRCRSLWQRPAVKREIDEELHFHLEQRTAENLAAGMLPEEAAREARKRFGNMQSIREECRKMRGASFGEATWKDFRFGVRMLRKNPGFTAVAVLTLALGIGVNTALFSVVNNLFFRPLPVKNPDELVFVVNKTPIISFLRGYEYPNYLDLRDQVSAFSGLIAYQTAPIHLDASGSAPERTFVAVVSGNYFSFFGVQATHGRLFLPGEGEKIGADPIVVLAHNYWQRRFGGDPSIVGKSVNVNGHPFTVVGIAPAEFTGTQAGMAASVFVPVTMVGHVMAGGERFLKARAGMPLNVMGRLKRGVSLDQALAAVNTVVAQIEKDYPQKTMAGRPMVVWERRTRPDPAFTEFIPLISSVFMGLVGLVLLIACANVANLMFSRAIVRRREMGIRAALGASRGQLIRQLLAESFLLSLVAGIVGLVPGYWGGNWLVRFGSSATPINMFNSSWDWRVFAFVVVMALFAGLLTGLMPAWKASRVDLQSSLKEGGGALLASSRHPFRSLLVASQVAISVVVLICGGVFLQSLQKASPQLLGFRADHMLMASLDLGLQGYDEARARRFQQQLLDKLEALPGVETATLGTFVPFSLYSAMTAVAPEGKRVRGIQDLTITPFGQVEPGFINAMGMTLLRGRNFSEQDTAAAPGVAIINEKMAERFWPGQDPLGKRLQYPVGSDLVQLEIVGIVHNGRYVMVGEAPSPFILHPLAQHYDMSPVTLFVRTQGDPLALAPAIRNLVQELDPHLPLYNVGTMERHLNDGLLALMPLRAGAALAGVQGLLALVLVVMGLYGVISFVVSQRTREIGIRMALGAQKGDVFRLVVGDGLKPALLGLAIGVVLSLGLTRVLSRILYGLAPGSAPVFAVAILLLLGVALLACWLPARRAAKVDPMEALRCE